MIYSDPQGYLKFLNENQIPVCTEDITNHSSLNETVLSEIDWDYVEEVYNRERIIVIDNFIKPEYALRMQKFALAWNFYDHTHKDCASVSYYKNIGVWYSILSSIESELNANAKFLNGMTQQATWSFVYNNESDGVPPHADWGRTNINFWVTPEECMNNKEGYNGLNIWKSYPPEGWTREQYNGNGPYVREFLKNNSPSKLSIEYKFNRAMIFDSLFFHESQPISSKPGYANRRVNYTFLYKKENDELQ
jgi:hypothetical protein